MIGSDNAIQATRYRRVDNRDRDGFAILEQPAYCTLCCTAIDQSIRMRGRAPFADRLDGGRSSRHRAAVDAFLPGTHRRTGRCTYSSASASALRWDMRHGVTGLAARIRALVVDCVRAYGRGSETLAHNWLVTFDRVTPCLSRCRCRLQPAGNFESLKHVPLVPTFQLGTGQPQFVQASHANLRFGRDEAALAKHTHAGIVRASTRVHW